MYRSTILIAALFLLFPAALRPQARKVVLFEHFTQASCGPCAAQNPAFQNTILKNNVGNILHVAYHTSWPGVDPMNAYNPADVQTRVNYYGITGVPTMVMLGGRFTGGPRDVTQAMVDDANGEMSPLRILVDESSDGVTRHATVRVYTLGAASGSLRLRTAVIESEVHYTSPPGSNGEKDFPNVFRKAVPDAGGSVFTPGPVGEAPVVVDFSYQLDPAHWDTARVMLVAWVQNESTREVLNAATHATPRIELVTEGALFLKGTPGVQAPIDARLLNLGTPAERVRIEFTAEAPADWSAAFLVNQAPVTGPMDVTVSESDPAALRFEVLPGATPGIGEYSITATFLDAPDRTPQRLRFNVIAGVTDLVVNNEAAWVAGSGIQSCTTTEKFFTDGLTAAGSSSHAATSAALFLRAVRSGVLGEVRHYYYNVGWAFPAFSADVATAFYNALNSGCNLMVVGQDACWDTFDSNGNGTSASRALYRNYLHSTLSSDGDSTAVSLNPAGDPVFGGIAVAALRNAYGPASNGASQLMPDHLNAFNGGVPIFRYASDPARIGGMRYATDKFRTVALGFGLECVEPSSVATDIVAQTWRWFHGLVTEVASETAVVPSGLGIQYPNPATDYAVLPIASSATEMRLEVVDVTGRVVLVLSVPAGSTRLRIPTDNLRSGVYCARLSGTAGHAGTRLLHVLR